VPSRDVYVSPQPSMLWPWRVLIIGSWNGGAGRIPAIARLVVVAILVFVCGVIASRPNEPPPTAPGAAATPTATFLGAVVAPAPGENPLAGMPTDFPEVAGYTPQVALHSDSTLRAVKPHANCSAPLLGAGPFDFSLACQVHDLGYDILRYADATGRPLGPDARRAVDHTWEHLMDARCAAYTDVAQRACHTTAAVYSFAVWANSWRQRFGTPHGEPAAAWATGLAVIVLLLLTRHHRRVRLFPDAPDDARQLADAPGETSAMRVASLVVLAATGALMSALCAATALYPGGGTLPMTAAWVLTKGLLVAPIVFFLGGRGDLAHWDRVRAHGGGAVTYLAGRAARLLRPALGFTMAWLAIAIPLSALTSPQYELGPVGHVLAQPLWLLGFYLLVTAATPLLAQLHRRLGWRLAAALALVPLGIDFLRAVTGSNLLGLANLVLACAAVHQLGFCYPDGGLPDVVRVRLGRTAAVGTPTLAALALLGWLPTPAFGDYHSAMPPAAALLALAACQLPLALLLRDRLARPIVGRSAGPLIVLCRAPVSLYLGALSAGLVVANALGLNLIPTVHQAGHLPAQLTEFVAVVPILLLIAWVEHAALPCRGAPDAECLPGRIAVLLGLAFATLGVLGFVRTGFGAWRSDATLLLLHVDGLQNLIHLLLGVSLLHAAHAGATARRRLWLLTAAACLPPLFESHADPATILLHVITLGIALTLSLVAPNAATPGSTGGLSELRLCLVSVVPFGVQPRRTR
jgi:hypothetical protein